jgi:hypothetical protein
MRTATSTSACHHTCRTCSEDDTNVGLDDECTSCFCGAEVYDPTGKGSGVCVAKPEYYGPADAAKLRCYYGCDDCIGTGEFECVYCSNGWYLEDGCPGRCVWCDENPAFSDKYPACGNRGGNWSAASECDCEAG